MDHVNISIEQGIGYLNFSKTAPDLDVAAVRAALRDSLSNLITDDSVQAIVVKGPVQTGLASGHRAEFDPAHAMEPTMASLLQLFDMTEKSVAIFLAGPINGALFDLAVACHYRIASADTVFRLRGWRQGRHIPAHGTTQRLPRLTGAKAALHLLFGNEMTAQQAVRHGLLDGVARSDVYKGGVGFLRKKIEEGSKPRPTIMRPVPLATVDQFQADVMASKETAQTPLSRRVVDCVEACHVLPPDVGLDFEAATLSEFENFAEFQPLGHLRRITMAHRAPPPESSPQVCLLGATDQSLVWLRLMLRAGIPASLFIPNPDHLPRVREVWKKRLSDWEQQNWGEERVTSDLAALPCDLVIDTQSYEKLSPAKLYEFVSPHFAKDTCVAFANQNAPDQSLSAVLPERAVCRMRLSRDQALIEWQGDALSGQQIARLCGALGVAQVQVQSSAADVSQRMEDVLYYVLECQLAAGISPLALDQAFTDAGWQIGPLNFAQRIGLKRYADRQAVFQATLPPTAKRPGVFDRILADDTAAGLLFETNDNVTKLHPTLAGSNRADVPVDRLLNDAQSALVAFSQHLVQTGILADDDAADLVSRHGLGYPAQLGGIVYHGHRVGLQKLSAHLRQMNNAAFDFRADTLDAGEGGDVAQSA